MATERREWSDKAGQKYGAEQQGKEGKWWKDDGEGVRTERENWEGEWVMGLEGAKGEEEMKVQKRGKTAGKIWPNESSCLQIYVVLWVSLYICRMRWRDSSNVMPLGLCVFICVCIAPYFYSHSSHCSCLFQSKLSLIERTHLWWGNIHPHPHCFFTKPIYLAPLVERREV